jgi:hypothetical protein
MPARPATKNQPEALAFHVSACTVLDPAETCPVLCRDATDQMFLDLAHSGKAGVLVTGDKDLPALAGKRRLRLRRRKSFGAGSKAKGRADSRTIRFTTPDLNSKPGSHRLSHYSLLSPSQRRVFSNWR